MTDRRAQRERAADGNRVRRTLRIADRRVTFEGEASWVARALGPLVALEEAVDSAESEGSDIRADTGPAANSTPRPPAGTPADQAVVFEPLDGGGRVRAAGVGCATSIGLGTIAIEIEPDAPDGDAVAELLTIPALAERLRREGVYLVHAAVLRRSASTGVFLVPARSGGGKTTLSLSLRRCGWRLLSDDRAWLTGAPKLARVDPWPEAPRVGDRSFFLLPPHVRAAPRDERTGKSPIPSLTPPRIDAPLPVVGVLLPSLVEGAGGRVTTARGADVLSVVASQWVVATTPETASAALAFVAAFLHTMPAFHVEVGDDPAKLSDEVARAIRSTSGESAHGDGRPTGPS